MSDVRANEDAQALSRYKDFIQRYTRQARGGFLYSEQLRRHARLGQHWLQVDLDDLRVHDEALANDLLRAPTTHLRLVSLQLFHNTFTNSTSSSSFFLFSRI